MPSEVFLSKAVRDLHWAIASPHLLSADSETAVLPDAWCADLVATSLPWLRELERDPQPLEEWLSKQRNVRRLGFYFASLLEFWVRECPALNGGGDGGGGRRVLVQQQVHAGINGEVAGQLKLVFHAGASVRHWESHVKFFAYCAAEPSAASEVEATEVEAEAAAACGHRDEGLASYVGPFLGENFLHRVVELRRKLSLSDAPAVRSFLSSHFGTDAEGGHLAQSVVRGYLFYPLQPPAGGAGVASAAAACRALSASHPRGWWCRSLNAVIDAFPPSSLWSVRGAGHASDAGGSGAVGGKLHWLAPAVAQREVGGEAAGADEAAGGGGAGGRLVIAGIRRLGVSGCAVLTATELRAAVGGDGPAEGAAPLLLLQLERREEPAGREVWVEASRGFLLPAAWDPAPLCREAPLILRGGMRQLQRERGVAAEDYREVSSASVALTKLAVRSGKEGGFGPRSDEPASEGGSSAEVVSEGEAAAGGDGAPDDGTGSSLAAAVRAEVCRAFPKLGPPLAPLLLELSASFLAACSDGDGEGDGDGDGEGGAARYADAVKALFASKDHAKGSGSKGGAMSNSLFVLGKATLGLCVNAGGGAEEVARRATAAVGLLRRVSCCAEPQRLVGSLSLAGVAHSGALVAGSGAARAFGCLLEECVRGEARMAPALLIEALALVGARAADAEEPPAAGGAPAERAAVWPPRLSRPMATRYAEALLAEEDPRPAAALVRQLRLMAAIDGRALLRRLVDGNMWQLAEQLALTEGGAETEEGEEEEEEESDEEASTDDAAVAAEGAERQVATALGGYLRAPAPRRRRARRFSADGAVAYLLLLAQQRQNTKLAARLSALVPTASPDGAVTSETAQRAARAAQLSRLVSRGLDDLAVTYAGQDRHLRLHLLQLLLAAGRADAEAIGQRLQISAAEIARLRSTATSTASAASASAAGSGLAGGGGLVAAAALPPYALPEATCIQVVDTHDEAQAAVRRLLRRVACGEVPPVCGIDAEWVGARPVALLQLALPAECVLLRLHTLAEQGPLPPAIAELLGLPSLLKCGVGIANDLRLLGEQYGLATASWLDLQPLASREGFHGCGLQRLSAEILGVHLSKAAELRCGDWEAETLSEAQVQYAARDAHVAVDIFSRLHSRLHSGLPSGSSGAQLGTPPPPPLEWCRPFIEMGGKRTSKRLGASTRPHAACGSSAAGDGTAQHGATTDGGDLDPSAVAVPPAGDRQHPSPTSRDATELGGTLGSSGLRAALAALGIAPESAALVPTEAEAAEAAATAAAATAAEAEAVAVKSLALFALGTPLVAVLPADRKLDVLRLARHLQLALTSRKAINRQVRLATPTECVERFGYAPGTVPPLGHRETLKVVVDPSVARSPSRLLAGGGDFGTLLSIVPSALTALSFVEVGAIASGGDVVGGGVVGGDVMGGDGIGSTGNDGAAAAAAAAAAVATGAACYYRAATGAVAAADSAVGVTSSVPPPGAGPARAEGAEEASGGPRFLVDGMMGKLLRWLRVLGIDTLLRDEGEDAKGMLSRAAAGQRILLTRDRKLPDRRDVGGTAIFVVGSDEPKEQLREVVEHFGLTLSPDEFMMRCAVCNSRGYTLLSKEDAARRGDCPPRVLEVVDEFYACRACGKLYWEGPKSNNAFGHFSDVFDGFGAVRSIGTRADAPSNAAARLANAAEGAVLQAAGPPQSAEPPPPPPPPELPEPPPPKAAPKPTPTSEKPPLGSIMALAKETGLPRSQCKAALMAHGNDYDAARWALILPAGPTAAEAEQAAASGEGGEGAAAADAEFEPSRVFAGARPGWLFTRGPKGLGYYPDPHARVDEPAECCPRPQAPCPPTVVVNGRAVAVAPVQPSYLAYPPTEGG